MTQIDKIYHDLVSDIIENGHDQTGNIRAKYADGSYAYTRYLPNPVTVTFTPEMGLPIITTKPVAVKSMLAELDWIWRKMSNNVQILRDMGSTIWNEWELPDGTIGPSYGFQLAKKCRNVNGQKLNQVEYVLHELKHNPHSRRIMTNLYDADDLDDMALEPCVFLTNWQVDNGRLHLNVVQRSADISLGVPFNWAQYGVLHRKMADAAKLKLGNMSWVILNAHVYLRHIPLLSKQIKEPGQEVCGLSKTVEVAYQGDDFFNTSCTSAHIIGYNPLEKDIKPSQRTYRYEVAI